MANFTPKCSTTSSPPGSGNFKHEIAIEVTGGTFCKWYYFEAKVPHGGRRTYRSKWVHWGKTTKSLTLGPTGWTDQNESATVDIELHAGDKDGETGPQDGDTQTETF